MARTGRLARLARLGGLATRVTSGWVEQRVKQAFQAGDDPEDSKRRFHVESAEQLVEVLGRLRGAAMKVGQGISLAVQHLDLPDEVRATLSRLQKDGEPVPFSKIRATVEHELEETLESLFTRFDPAPLGTASLAQAHAATLPDGREVVVKVLHEGVEEAVESDLLALRAVLFGGRAFGREQAELDGLYAELRERLLEELDYLQEAVNLEAFHEAFGDRPGVRVPRHVPHLCTERVLVMDRLPGMSLQTFLQTASPEARQRAGENLAHFFLDMAFRRRLLHADPNPGNYLFEEDGTVDVLDFGCVKRLDRWWMAHYARGVRAALDGDAPTLLQAVRDMGAWTGQSEGAAQVVQDFCEAVVGPWRGREFTIGGPSDDLLETLTPILKRLWSYPEIVGPPEILFLHRTLGGLYSTARRLQVRGRWEDIMRPYLDDAIAAGS